MAYSGNVVVGGRADVRELPQLIMSKLAVGPYNNNAYLLRCRSTGQQLLIDAAAEPDRLAVLVGDSLDFVLTTHLHKDHWQALAPVVERTAAITLAGALDAPEIPVPTQVLLNDGDEIMFGDITLRAMHLVGHTPGSIAVAYDDPDGHSHIWTGDCLFPGGVGNTWEDPDRFATLYEDVTSKIFDAFSDETWIYPGHGGDTTIGAERPHLAEWAERGW